MSGSGQRVRGTSGTAPPAESQAAARTALGRPLFYLTQGKGDLPASSKSALKWKVAAVAAIFPRTRCLRPGRVYRVGNVGKISNRAAGEQRTRSHVGSCELWSPTGWAAGRRGGGPRVQFVNSHTRISPLGLSLGSGLPAGGLAERPIAWVASAMQLAGGPPATECSLSWHDWPSWRPRPPSSSEISASPDRQRQLFPPSSRSLLPQPRFRPPAWDQLLPGANCTPCLHHGHLPSPRRPGGRD